DCFVRVGKRDLERLTTEVMQLREFLPRVMNNLVDMLHKTSAAEKVNGHFAQEQERLRQECLHLGARLEAAQSKCQREREMQEQAEFCTGLGAASCTVLWSASGREQAVGKLHCFLDMAAQTLESFVKSVDEEPKAEAPDQISNEQQFVLALAGVITNVAAVACGRDYLSSCGHVLLDTLMQLLKTMKPGAFPKLKVLMLMALYNVTICVRGLKYISESPGLLPMIWTLLE
ncbi:hypothetical protein CRUP_014160, partial [Coryphaenoides rupestris]